MRKPLHFVFALALASAVGAPVLAQQAEYTPDVANCGDPSYDNAVKNGITLGSNDNPPEFYQDANKEPAGIDWEINKAVLLVGILVELGRVDVGTKRDAVLDRVVIGRIA